MNTTHTINDKDSASYAKHLISRSNSTPTYLSLVTLVAEGAMVWTVIGVCPHVLTYVPDSLEQLTALTTLVPALSHVHLHVLLQHVACEELLVTIHTLKWFVTCQENSTECVYFQQEKKG